jgi:predicted TIM-barrel fold metal-dependent hydrolase
MSLIAKLAIKGMPLRDYVEIIDCHAHMGPSGWMHLPNNSPDEMVKVMDSVGVSKVCVSHCIALGSDFRLGNKLVYEALRKHPDRFVGYAVLNPHYPDEIEEELEICFKHYGMKAIKFHANMHQMTYYSDYERYKPVLEYAEANNLAILCHGMPSMSKKLEELSYEYRNVNFIMAHYGGWNMRDLPEAMAVASKAPNVYIDSSGSVEWFGGFEKAVARIGAEKILFGSDFPWGNLAFMIGRVVFANISDEEKKKILGLNAKELKIR